MAQKIPCISHETGKIYLIKDYGDTNNYGIMSVNKNTKEVTIKIDKRLTGNPSQFLFIYGGYKKSVLTLEEKIEI